MSWFDFFDDILSGSSSNNGKSGSFSSFALSEFAAQVPYIGQYLGFYLTGREDLSDLTDFPTGPARADSDAESNRAERSAREEFGIDDGPRQKLISRTDLLADNTTPKVSNEPWMDTPRSPPSMGQEQSLDIGGYPRAPVAPPPQPEPMLEVVVRAPHPDRSKPPPLPNPQRRAPYRPPPESRPELQAPPRAEAAPAVQWTQEIIIAAEPSPFDREVSDPEALARAEGVGRIEWGDLMQLLRGGYNGFISTWQQAARLGVKGAVRHMAGPILEPMLSPYAESPISEADKYRLSIDPRYAGAGMVGDLLVQNLVFEALPYAPHLGRLASRAAKSGHLIAPTFWFMGAEGFSGSSQAGRAIHRAAAHAANAGRLEEALAEVTAQKQVAEDIIMLETGIAKPKSGLSQAEVLGHLRRLRERSSYAADAYRAYTAAIETLSNISRQQGREIFWDPRWIRPR